MKHVDACVSARAYRESSFHRCGGPVMLVIACLCAGRRADNAVLTSKEVP